MMEEKQCICDIAQLWHASLVIKMIEGVKEKKLEKAEEREKRS